MTSLRTKYNNTKTIDKIVYPGIIVALLTAALVFSGDFNFLISAGILISVAIAIHLVLSRTYDVIAGIVFLIHITILLPSMYLYGFLANENQEVAVVISIASVYLFAATYLAMFFIFKWSTGHLWLKLLLGFLSLDVVAPILAVYMPPNRFLWAIVFAAALIGIVSVPWGVLRTPTMSDIPFETKKLDISNAMEGLISELDGVEVKKSKGSVVDFVAIKGKKRFHVTVLGSNTSLKISNQTIQYGPYNIKPLVYQTAIDSITRFRNSRNIPVVVNYSDPTDSFVEVNAKIKANKKRGRPVILTTPLALVEIMKNNN